MLISCIHVLGATLPIAGRTFGIARVTDVDGEIPAELTAATYKSPEGVKIKRVTAAPSDLKAENSQLEDMMALYVVVEEIRKNDTPEWRIVETIDDFLAALDFPDNVKADYAGFFLGVRSKKAGLANFTFDLEDDETHEVTPCMGWYNSYEEYYINTQKSVIEKAGSPVSVGEILDINQASDLMADGQIQILFGEMMDKTVDLYNGLNYYNYADIIAEQISKITYISESGVKGPLNMTAVEKLFSNVKDRLLIGTNIRKPVLRVNKPEDEQ